MVGEVPHYIVIRNPRNILFGIRLVFMVLIQVADLFSQGTASSLGHRVIISTDIGGTDPDDFQSMIHFLMYADRFQTEGLIASPYGDGRKRHIMDMIALYAKDYPKLKRHGNFPEPWALRQVTKQGALSIAPRKGWDAPTEGSEWIIKMAQKDDDHPLWILVWGGLEDVAQALHDAPEIQDRIRVYWIGGPNKKWSVNAYAYIVENHGDLWMIEANATYRGWFMDEESPAKLTNQAYFDHFIRGRGAMGKDFRNYYDGILKMGDSPSLVYLMDGNPDDPLGESWGGQFTLLDHSAKFEFRRHTSLDDTICAYAVLEWYLEGPKLNIPPDSACMTVDIWNQKWPGYYLGDGIYTFRYASKKPEIGTYKISSPIEELHGQTGQYVSITPWPGTIGSHHYQLGSYWFSDSSEPADFIGVQQGANTVSKHREKILLDWAERWSWLK